MFECFRLWISLLFCFVGVRLYFTTTTARVPLERPSKLELVHTRLPPGFAPSAASQRPSQVHTAFYRQGGPCILLMSFLFVVVLQVQQRNWSGDNLMTCFSLLRTLCWAVNYCFIASVCLSSYGRLQEVAKQDVCDSSFSSAYQSAKCMCNSISTQLKPRTNTPYSKMAANKLFFCLHVNKPSSPRQHV